MQVDAQASEDATVWAASLPGGPIDVLVFGPSHAEEDAAHLVARLETNLTFIAFDSFEPGLGPSEEVQTAIAKARKNPPEVIVLALDDARSLPNDLQMLLLDLSRDDAGLVLVRYGDRGAAVSRSLLSDLSQRANSDPVLRGVGADMLTGLQKDMEEVRLYEGGGRRAVELAYWGNAPETHALLPSAPSDAAYAPMLLDNYLSLLARAIRWAGGRDPALRIEGLFRQGRAEPDDLTTPPQLPPEFVQRMRDASVQPLSQTYALLFDRPAAKKYRVETQVRYPYRDIRWRHAVDEPVARGADRFLFALPGGFGEYLVDVWLMDGDDVIDWFTESVDVEGWPEIRNVQFSSYAIEENDRLEVSLTVREHFHRPRPCTVFVHATDALGRLVAENRIRVSDQGGAISAELVLVDLLTPYLKVEVFAADTDAPALSQWSKEHSAYSSAHVLVRRTDENAFRVMARGSAASEFNARLNNRALARRGVDLLRVDSGEETFGVPAFDTLEIVPTVATHHLGRCYFDAAIDPQKADALILEAQRYRRFGTGLYAINVLSDSQHSVCLSEFPAFLAAAYPDITRLNAAWGAQHADWTDAANATLTSSTAQRMEWRAYREDHLQRTLERVQAEIRHADPSARVGIDPGAVNVASLDAPLTGMFSVPPDRVAVARARNARTMDNVALLFADAAALEEAPLARWLPWFAVANGMQGIRVSGDAGSVAETLWQETAQVRAGVHDLLRSSMRMKSQIAIYDSRSSHRLDGVLPGPKSTSTLSQDQFARALSVLGYPFDLIEYEDAIVGRLDEYALCILPFARALSDEEVVALERFAQGGGELVADVPPGSYDEHGLQRNRESLSSRISLIRVDESATLFGEHIQTRKLATSIHDTLAIEASASVDITAYSYADAKVFALLNDPHGIKDSDRARLLIPDDRYGYAPLRGDYYKPGAKAFAKLERGEAAILTLLPYEVTRLELDADEAVGRGRRLRVGVKVKTKQRLPGDHMLHISVRDPQNRPLDHYARTITCPAGAGETHIPFALNDPAGPYTVTVRDVLTGLTESTEFTVW